MRPETSCMCPYIRPISTQTKFVILMHPMEFKKIKNGTGVLAHLMLSNSEIIIDVDFTDNRRVNELLDLEDNECFILYPGKTSLNLSRPSSAARLGAPENKRTIFILDATWPCAKKMLKLSSNLQNVPFVSFTNDQKSKFTIKQQPNELCLSTIESIKKVIDDLNRLEIESVNTGSFLRPFEKMIEYQIECVKNPNNKNHSYKKKTSMREREYYKTGAQRALFYDKENFDA